MKGDEVDAAPRGEREFELRSGAWAARLSGGACVFDGQPIPWRIERGESFVAVDAVCHQGARRALPFAALGPVILAAGLQLVDRRGETAPFAPVDIEHDTTSGTIRRRFGGLELTTLDRAIPVPE